MLRQLLRKRSDWCARFSALVLLFALFLPFAVAAVGQGADPDASLPACCRTHGRHHCAMGLRAADRDNGRPAVSYIHEKCPCTLSTAPSHVAPLLTGELSTAPFAADGAATAALLVAAPSLSRDDSNPDRGPPVFYA